MVPSVIANDKSAGWPVIHNSSFGQSEIAGVMFWEYENGKFFKRTGRNNETFSSAILPCRCCRGTEHNRSKKTADNYRAAVAANFS